MIMPEVSFQEWEKFFNLNPQAHIFQSPYWGELKTNSKWKPVRIVKDGCGIQIMFREAALGYTMAFVSRGPIGNDWRCLWPEVDQVCRAHRAFFLKLEPDISEEDGLDMGDQGFTRSNLNIEPRRTIVLDISRDEDVILAGMKKKTRYNIGLAGKKGVVAKPSSDIKTFYKLMRTTCKRNRIGSHSLEYFRKAYQLFHQAGKGELLVADYQGIPLAVLFTAYHGKRAWSVYGGSSNQHRNLMSEYLLQWESIRWARQQGCTQYDLFGIPDLDEEELEAQFTSHNDGLWGVYRFKRGFDGEVKRNCQSWDRVYEAVPYKVFKALFSTQSMKNFFYQFERIFRV
jgi:lipid II:glycine glycyltransferase (peptidoglycan interpeptide bridge formation enzyme)